MCNGSVGAISPSVSFHFAAMQIRPRQSNQVPHNRTPQYEYYTASTFIAAGRSVVHPAIQVELVLPWRFYERAFMASSSVLVPNFPALVKVLRARCLGAFLMEAIPMPKPPRSDQTQHEIRKNRMNTSVNSRSQVQGSPKLVAVSVVLIGLVAGCGTAAQGSANIAAKPIKFCYMGVSGMQRPRLPGPLLDCRLF